MKTRKISEIALVVATGLLGSSLVVSNSALAADAMLQMDGTAKVVQPRPNLAGIAAALAKKQPPKVATPGGSLLPLKPGPWTPTPMPIAPVPPTPPATPQPPQPPQVPLPLWPPHHPSHPMPPSDGWNSPGWGNPEYMPTAPSGWAGVPSNQVPSLARNRLVVLNPTDNEGNVAFLLRGHDVGLAAGQTAELKLGESGIVRFDRGNGYGVARYKVRPGTYMFRVEDGRWELYRKHIKVTIDNRDNEVPFAYLLDNEVKQVPAGELAVHESDYPIQIAYDPGNGQEPTVGQMIEGNFQVTLNDAGDGVALVEAESASSLAATE